MNAKYITGLFLLAWAAIAAAQSQTETSPAAAPAPYGASSDTAGAQEDQSDAQKRKKRRREGVDERPIGSGADTTLPQTVADAPLPPQGVPEARPTIVRGPLSVRQTEFSLGVDHLISPDLAVGGLAGYAQGKLHRIQTSFFGGSSIPGLKDDTSIRTRSGSAAAILSWFPAPNVFVDAALSYAHTSFHVDRLVNDVITFSGETAGRGYGVSVNGGYVARFGALALVPQVGLDYVDARVDGFRITAVPEGVTDPADFFKIDIADQRLKTLTGSVGAQLQWANSVPFGTLTPYLRALHRHRLSSSANTVRTSSQGAEDLLIDPADSNPGRSVTIVGLGLLAQFTHGVGAFIDYSDSVDRRPRLTKLALGLRFEF